MTAASGAASSNGARRVAAIDIGTNSVLLTVAEARAGELVPIVDRATITRLGQGVDRARQLNPDAAERTLACLRSYAAELEQSGRPVLDVVGTSALRDAGGAREFLEEAERVLGVRPRVIDGLEEARLTFLGALSGLKLRGRALVFDVGGGSTELIAGDADERRIEASISLDVGGVRLQERHVRSDPPSEAELAAVREDVRRELTKAPRPQGEFTLVGVAGTVTTLKAVALELEPYDANRVHGARLSRAEVDDLRSRFAAVTLSERKNMIGLQPARADVIVPGAEIVSEVLDFAGQAELVVSDRGVRYGLLEALAARPA